jgi:hypothetical protein
VACFVGTDGSEESLVMVRRTTVSRLVQAARMFPVVVGEIGGAGELTLVEGGDSTDISTWMSDIL